MTFNGMRNGLAEQRVANHLATGFLLRLLNSKRNLLALGVADADLALLVADHDERGKAEAASAGNGGTGAIHAHRSGLDA